MTTTLTSLIAEANDSGWAVTLRQHPDRKAYWEAHLSRPTERNANGIVRETCFAIAPDPYAALDLALDYANANGLTIYHHPSGLTSTEQPAAPDLLALLNLQPDRKVPTITRR